MQKGELEILCNVIADIVYIIVVCINKRSDVFTQFFGFSADRIHRIQVMAVIWIAEIDRSVPFTENAVIVEIAGCIAVYVGIVPARSG